MNPIVSDSLLITISLPDCFLICIASDLRTDDPHSQRCLSPRDLLLESRNRQKWWMATSKTRLPRVMLSCSPSLSPRPPTSMKQVVTCGAAPSRKDSEELKCSVQYPTKTSILWQPLGEFGSCPSRAGDETTAQGSPLAAAVGGFKPEDSAKRHPDSQLVRAYVMPVCCFKSVSFGLMSYTQYVMKTWKEHRWKTLPLGSPFK